MLWKEKREERAVCPFEWSRSTLMGTFMQVR